MNYSDLKSYIKNFVSAKSLRLCLICTGLILWVTLGALGGESSPSKLAGATPMAPSNPTSNMIYHCIRYTVDPQKLDDFETYARRWMEGGIIKRCGGEPLGYFLPKKGYGGPDNIAMALIGFKSLAAYEQYRAKLVADPEAKENLEFAKRSGCILTEDRSYFYRIGNEH